MKKRLITALASLLLCASVILLPTVTGYSVNSDPYPDGKIIPDSTIGYYL